MSHRLRADLEHAEIVLRVPYREPWSHDGPITQEHTITLKELVAAVTGNRDSSLMHVNFANVPSYIEVD